MQVLKLLAEGYSNSAMSEKLFVSDSTVRTHLRKLPRVVVTAKLERARMLIRQGNAYGAREELDRADDRVVWERVARQRLPAHDVLDMGIARMRWEVHFGDAADVVRRIDDDLPAVEAEARVRRSRKLRVLKAMALWRLNAVDVAAPEQQPRAHGMARDHVVGQADVARQRQVDVEQPVHGLELVGFVHRRGVQHAGPGVAAGVAVVVLAGGRVHRQPEARGGLPEAAALEVQQSFGRLGVHAVEHAAVLRLARRIQQALRFALLAHHRGHVRHAVGQHRVGEGNGGGQARQPGAAGLVRFVVAIEHGQQQRLQRVDVAADHRRVAGRDAALVQDGHRLGRALREQQRPDVDRLHQRVGLQHRRRHRPEPARQQPHAALFEEALRVVLQQFHRVREIAALDRMVDRRHWPADRLVPAGSGQVQPQQVVRMHARQLRAQEVGEQAVKAVIRLVAGRLHRQQEQAGGVQVLQHARAVRARHERLAQRRAELAQDAGAQQELAHLGRLPAQHVFREIFGDGAAGARKAMDEIGGLGVPVERHGGEQQRGDPAFGLAVQHIKRLGRHAEA
ncbi:MAG: hypothetical protein EOO24_34910, partial [Comamonadaceae bacterium]